MSLFFAPTQPSPLSYTHITLNPSPLIPLPTCPASTSNDSKGIIKQPSRPFVPPNPNPGQIQPKAQSKTCTLPGRVQTCTVPKNASLERRVRQMNRCYMQTRDAKRMPCTHQQIRKWSQERRRMPNASAPHPFLPKPSRERFCRCRVSSLRRGVYKKTRVSYEECVYTTQKCLLSSFVRHDQDVPTTREMLSLVGRRHLLLAGSHSNQCF